MNKKVTFDDFILSDNEYASGVKYLIQDEYLEKDACLSGVHRIFVLLVEDLISFSNIRFTSLFAQIVYLKSQYAIPNSFYSLIHIFRAGVSKCSELDNKEDFIMLGAYIISELSKLLESKEAKITEKPLFHHLITKEESTDTSYEHFVRGMLYELDTENKTFKIVSEAGGTKSLIVYYDIPDRNEIFTKILEAYSRKLGRPFYVHLIHNEISDAGITPQIIIIEPDYLIDVTTVANAFIGKSTFPLLMLLRKYLPIDTASEPLMLGNAVNDLFDGLLSDEPISFKEFVDSMFKKSATTLSLYGDQQAIELVDKLRLHYRHITEIIHQRFPKIGIDINQVQTEASYYSVKYGLQGRLDMLHQTNERIDIIELKSGSAFQPNTYGISASHYIQTLLYDLMVEGTLRKKKARSQYILYSKLQDGLRFAPIVYAQQLEAIAVRNAVYYAEYLHATKRGVYNLLLGLEGAEIQSLKGFTKRDVDRLWKTFQRQRPIIQHYFLEFSAFISRERFQSKLGDARSYSKNGLAAMWTATEQDKLDSFLLMKRCEIVKIEDISRETWITFRKERDGDHLTNFRKADIVVAYPYAAQAMNTVRSQLFKGTIVDLDSDNVTIKLRSKVMKSQWIREVKYWNIEPDILDSSFKGQYTGLYSFISTNQDAQDLILGTRSPKKYEVAPRQGYTESTSQTQQEICDIALSSKEYYLIWGPPGTGKTSVILRNLVDQMEREGEKVLLLAYTNRAVDEICEALEQIKCERKMDYIRIGSHVGCGERYRSALLEERVRDLKKREEVLHCLQSSSIYVGTVASILHRQELFRLVRFTKLIVDEASQILEPSIIPLLGRVPHWILIGDHKQLPAVVTQATSSSKIEHDSLKEIGIQNMRTSFFERLYINAKGKGWRHVFGMLSEQGRMHPTIAAFVNKNFYEGRLKNFASRDDFSLDTSESQPYDFSRRLQFIDCPSDDGAEWKTNIHEAKATMELIEVLLDRLIEIGKDLSSSTIGVITPYRAQIAMIKKMLSEVLAPKIVEKITVDTVERYQGGARDIIIYSMCTNNRRQLDALIDIDEYGVDRKLNVAMTRARNYLFILGNKSLVSNYDLYKDLVAAAHGTST